MTESNRRQLSTYKVEFEDGTIAYAKGAYAAHAWAVVRELNPDQEIKSFQLLAETRES